MFYSEASWKLSNIFVTLHQCLIGLILILHIYICYESALKLSLNLKFFFSFMLWKNVIRIDTDREEKRETLKTIQLYNFTQKRAFMKCKIGRFHLGFGMLTKLERFNITKPIWNVSPNAGVKQSIIVLLYFLVAYMLTIWLLL